MTAGTNASVTSWEHVLGNSNSSLEELLTHPGNKCKDNILAVDEDEVFHLTQGVLGWMSLCWETGNE